MSRNRLYMLSLALIVVLALGGCTVAAPAPASETAAEPAPAATEAPAEEAAGEAAAGTFEPGQVECIAPANPGGGWDWTCRTAAQVLNEAGIVPRTIQVTNMAGGGGGIAYAHTVTQRNDDDNLIVAASPATTLRLAQKQFENFTVDEVRWLAALGAEYAVISVAKDSPFQNLDDLINALKEDPTSVNFGGGSAIGGQDHMKVLILAQEAGLDPLALKYTPFDGGGEAMTAMLGGFIDVFPGDISEVLGQVEAGDVRAIAVLAPERQGGLFEDVPTAREQGYPVDWVIFRGFYVPGNMSDAAYNWWIDAMTQMSQSSEWAEARDQVGMDDYFLAGDDFQQFIENQVADFQELSRDLGLID